MTTQVEKTALIAAIQTALNDANAIIVEPDVNPLQALLDAALAQAVVQQAKIDAARAALA